MNRRQERSRQRLLDYLRWRMVPTARGRIEPDHYYVREDPNRIVATDNQLLMDIRMPSEETGNGGRRWHNRYGSIDENRGSLVQALYSPLDDKNIGALKQQVFGTQVRRIVLTVPFRQFETILAVFRKMRSSSSVVRLVIPLQQEGDHEILGIEVTPVSAMIALPLRGDMVRSPEWEKEDEEPSDFVEKRRKERAAFAFLNLSSLKKGDDNRKIISLRRSKKRRRR